jgi:hypothetical protein
MRLLLLPLFTFSLLPLSAQWSTVGQNAQHTGISTVASQTLGTIKWSTLVAQDSSERGPGDILIHFGAPIITAANSVFVPVRGDQPAHNYSIEMHRGSDGALLRTLTTGWVPPPNAFWTPSYAPGLSTRNRFYYPDAAGIMNYVDSPDNPASTTHQLAFYGSANPSYTDLAISTPIVSDRLGNIFFGFIVSGLNAPPGMTSGIARISFSGVGTWVAATTAANLTPTEASQTPIAEVPINCAPALSIDSSTLYFAVNNGSATSGFLVSINAATLAPIAHIALIDPQTLTGADVPVFGSASPVVGPDGDVYYGVLENGCPSTCNNDDRGWLLHFNGSLSALKTPGAFGWDDTPSIVPYALVPSYSGHSSYLIFTKCNNYFGVGPHGDGLNKIAILDPNATETDPVTGVAVMNEVMTILGATTDGFGAPTVKEWCINNAAIDKVKKSALVNSEDGVLYRWDFTTNSFTERITLTAGIGEAYTPTVIGPDGTVYAINDGELFAVGHP